MVQSAGGFGIRPCFRWRVVAMGTRRLRAWL